MYLYFYSESIILNLILLYFIIWDFIYVIKYPVNIILYIFRVHIIYYDSWYIHHTHIDTYIIQFYSQIIYYSYMYPPANGLGRREIHSEIYFPLRPFSITPEQTL